MLRISQMVFVGFCLLNGVARADFMPANNLHLEDGLLRGQNLTEKDFNEVIDEAEAVYIPLIKEAQGGKLREDQRPYSNEIRAVQRNGTFAQYYFHIQLKLTC